MDTAVAAAVYPYIYIFRKPATAQCFGALWQRPLSSLVTGAAKALAKDWSPPASGLSFYRDENAKS